MAQTTISNFKQTNKQNPNWPQLTCNIKAVSTSIMRILLFKVMAKIECHQSTYETNMRANVIYITVVLKFTDHLQVKNVSFVKNF
jgi:hypothetical protein